MKILFYRYGNICEQDVIDCFRSIGLDVVAITSEINNKKLTDRERIALVSTNLDKDSYLFVFSINFFPAISDLCQIYSTFYLCWTVDAPIIELFRKSVSNPCNKIFCFDKQQYSEISPYNPEGIFHLPLCTNVSRWEKVINSITSDDIKRYSCDISFVGNLYLEKDPINSIQNIPDYINGYIDGITSCQTKIQGINITKKSINQTICEQFKFLLPQYYPAHELFLHNIDSFITSHSILDVHCSSFERINYLLDLSNNYSIKLFTRSNSDCFTGSNIIICDGVNTYTEMPKVFNLSKININMTLHSIETGIPLRCFDIMGCNGFLLSNYQEELLDYFVPGEDFDYFSDSDELIDKCDFYLSHDTLRKKIATNGFNKVSKLHTYTQRIPLMISKICN